jgi:hypothetical protein
MPYAGRVTNSTRLELFETLEDGGWKIDDRHLQSSILHSRSPILHPLITRPADQRPDTDDAEKKLVDGNLVRRSDLAKGA